MHRRGRQIVLIGFKHVGKTQVGKRLARRLRKPFTDLDRQIEKVYADTFDEALSSRQIMQRHGEDFFRRLETKVLRQTLTGPSGVLATGGGTPLRTKNQWLLKKHQIIYIQAPAELIFERIMRRGRPAFFPEHIDPLLSFQKLWAAREPIYRSLNAVVVENKDSVTDTVEQIVQKLARKAPGVAPPK